MKEKTITLSADEYIAVLVALDDKLQSYEEIHAAYAADSGKYTDSLEWCEGCIRSTRALYRKFLSA